MKKKLTTLLFGLLLAVGWTSSAQAQSLPSDIWSKAPTHGTNMSMMETNGHSGVNKEASKNVARLKQRMASQSQTFARPDANGISVNVTNQGQQHRAPQRSSNFSSTVPATIYPKSWYQALPPVTWNGGSQNITEPFTTVDGMMALVERVYTDKDIPGAKYSGTAKRDIVYQTIQRGWDIIGNNYDDIELYFGSGYIDIVAIRIVSGTDTTIWAPTSTTTSLPSGWDVDGTLRFESLSSYGYSGLYAAYLQSGGSIYIPASQLANSNGYVIVDVAAIFTGSSQYQNFDYTVHAIGNNTYDWGVVDSIRSSGIYWYSDFVCSGTITPPDECGYTVMLVKLYDGKNQDGVPPYEAIDRTTTKAELKQYFTDYIKEIDLLTDGIRVNTDNDNIGTVFAYTGDLSRFYFISKGKLYYMTSLNCIEGDIAPFYSMYEEFSPAVEAGNEDHTDFYTELRKGVTYPIVHDCQSVNYLQHYFSMSGKHGTDENRVNSLVLYIPDNRANTQQLSRTYVPNHQPTVGMYMVDLFADIEPAAQDGYYETTVTWEDNLDAITHSDGIPQTYYLYQVIDGDTICVTPNGTDQTTWNSADYGIYYEAGAAAYEIHYFVVATPTGATNPDTFYAQSAPDNVTVPGTSDFIGLQWWRYESDYVTDNGEKQEVNYYRNWLAPHKLSLPGQAGISAGNVGAGRKLTLYRNETPVIDLELVMDGNKAYYRIKYRDANNQEIEPGYGSDGEVDPNYNPNNN